MIKDNWYEVKDLARIDSPAMLIFPDRVKANIRAAIVRAGILCSVQPGTNDQLKIYY